jgi:hypothetical protein
MATLLIVLAGVPLAFFLFLMLATLGLASAHRRQAAFDKELRARWAENLTSRDDIEPSIRAEKELAA